MRRPGRQAGRVDVREILAAAVPAVGALAAEPLYLLADGVIIGRLGTAELAGFGLASALLMNAVYLCVFLAFGTTAAVARRLGAGEREGAVELGAGGGWLGLCTGVGLGVVGAATAPALIQAFGASATASPHAELYLQISSAGLPAMLVTLALTGALRGLGDARTPMVVALSCAALNAALNVLLVLGLDRGVAGAAAGTVTAQTAGAVWLLVVFARAAGGWAAVLRPRRRAVRASAAAGLPLLARTGTLRVAFLGATFVATSQGDVALASHQLALSFWMLLAIPSEALGVAGQSVVGHRLGAGDVTGARATADRMVRWGLLSGLVLGLLVVVLRPAYVPVLTSAPDVGAVLLSVLLAVAVLQPVGSVVFVLDGVLIGAGDGRFLAVAGAWTVCAFIPLAVLVLVLGAGVAALWWALVVFLVARLWANVARLRSGAAMVPGLRV